MMSVLLVLANLPNSVIYRSATRRFTAFKPPFSFIASAIFLIPFDVASATDQATHQGTMDNYNAVAEPPAAAP